MLPLKELSLTLVKGEYFYPDNIITAPTMDFELGGVDLQDPSQGLQVKSWAAYIDGHNIWLSAADREAVLVLTRPGLLTEVSLAFDRNMRYTIVFVEDGLAYLYWYDTLTAGYAITPFEGIITPKLTHDDKRDDQSAASDILFVYIRDNALYFRAQRDRYGVEYLLRADVNGTLEKIGMTNKNRVQFKLLPIT